MSGVALLIEPPVLRLRRGAVTTWGPQMRVIIAVAVISTASLAPACVQAQAPASERATLSVVGNGEVLRKPELARVDVSLTTRGPTLDGTSRDHQRRVAQAAHVIEQLKSQGVVVEGSTFDLSEEIAPLRSNGDPAHDRQTYRAATHYELMIQTLETMDAIAAEISSSGLFEMGESRFFVADQNAALDDARREAMADATRQARVYADAGGVRLDSIVRIADGQVRTDAQSAFVPRARFHSASVGVVPPPSLSFSGSVVVTWSIAPR